METEMYDFSLGIREEAKDHHAYVFEFQVKKVKLCESYILSFLHYDHDKELHEKVKKYLAESDDDDFNLPFINETSLRERIRRLEEEGENGKKPRPLDYLQNKEQLLATDPLETKLEDRLSISLHMHEQNVSPNKLGLEPPKTFTQIERELDEINVEEIMELGNDQGVLDDEIIKDAKNSEEEGGYYINGEEEGEYYKNSEEEGEYYKNGEYEEYGEDGEYEEYGEDGEYEEYGEDGEDGKDDEYDEDDEDEEYSNFSDREAIGEFMQYYPFNLNRYKKRLAVALPVYDFGGIVVDEDYFVDNIDEAWLEAQEIEKSDKILPFEQLPPITSVRVQKLRENSVHFLFGSANPHHFLSSIKTFPFLTVGVFVAGSIDKNNDETFSKEKLGVGKLHFGENFIKAIMNACSLKLIPQSASIDTKVPIFNALNEPAGEIEVFFRMTCYGEAIWPQTDYVSSCVWFPKSRPKKNVKKGVKKIHKRLQ